MAPMLPPAIEHTAWQISGNPYTYVPNNLYSYIDGAADMFIAYGFVKLQGAEYVDTADKQESMTVDMYDMGSPLSAFGIFNSKKDPESPSLNIGAGSCGTEQFVIFYKDRLYVEIQPRIARDKNKPVPVITAQKIAARIPGTTNPPREIQYLPALNKVPGSENYVTGGILGHAFLPHGLVSDYRFNGETVKAFIAMFPTEKDSSAAFERYKAYLKEAGETVTAGEGGSEKGFNAKEKYHGHVIVVNQGCFIAGVADLSHPEKGKMLLKQILDNLKTAA
jgi:hypothetical protein